MTIIDEIFETYRQGVLDKLMLDDHCSEAEVERIAFRVTLLHLLEKLADTIDKSSREVVAETASDQYRTGFYNGVSHSMYQLSVRMGAVEVSDE